MKHIFDAYLNKVKSKRITKDEEFNPGIDISWITKNTTDDDLISFLRGKKYPFVDKDTTLTLEYLKQVRNGK